MGNLIEMQNYQEQINSGEYGQFRADSESSNGESRLTNITNTGSKLEKVISPIEIDVTAQAAIPVHNQRYSKGKKSIDKSL